MFTPSLAASSFKALRSSSRLVPARTSMAPALANANARVRPRPRPAPETSTRFPSISIRTFSRKLRLRTARSPARDLVQHCPHHTPHNYEFNTGQRMTRDSLRQCLSLQRVDVTKELNEDHGTHRDYREYRGKLH